METYDTQITLAFICKITDLILKFHMASKDPFNFKKNNSQKLLRLSSCSGPFLRKEREREDRNIKGEKYRLILVMEIEFLLVLIIVSMITLVISTVIMP